MFNYNVQTALRRLQDNPKEFLQKFNVNIPDELMGNPQAMVMHLIQTGQVRNPRIEKIMPMIQSMVKR